MWTFIKSWIRNNLKGDIVIWIVAIVLCFMSLPLVYSATGRLAFKNGMGHPESFLFKHVIFVFSGLGLTWFIHRIPYTKFANWSRAFLWLSVPLLLALLRFGDRKNEAVRSLNLGGFEFQPADFARLTLITYLALMLAKRQRTNYTWQTMTNMLIWVGIICFCLAVSGSTTATVIVGGTCFLMFYIGRVPRLYLFYILFGLSFVTVGGALVSGRWDTIEKRVSRFVNMEEAETRQVLIAVANGSWEGRGMGKSHQRNYIDQAYSDYIYAIIIEEYGFFAGIVVMALYLVLLVRGVNNIKMTDRPFGGLLSAGLTLSIVLQAFIHISVSVNNLPATGQPLPLLSKGGTSMLVTCIALGVILSVSRGVADESEL